MNRILEILKNWLKECGLLKDTANLDEIDLKGFQEEIEEVVTEIQEEAVEGLTKNRDALLKEKKDLQRQLNRLKSSGGTSDQADDKQIDALENKIEELQNQLSDANNNLKKMERESVALQKKSTTQIEKLTNERDAERNAYNRLIVDNGLTTELMGANIKKEYLPAVMAYLNSKVQVVTEGEERSVKVGDKALKDFIAEWSQSDEGKAFVAAPVNTGGGAGGSQKAGSAAASSEGVDLRYKELMEKKEPLTAAESAELNKLAEMKRIESQKKPA